MRVSRMLLMLPLLVVLATGCGSAPRPAGAAGTPISDVATIVQATLGAMTAQPSAPPATATLALPTPLAKVGSISGSLSYPADSLPPMFVTAYQVGTRNYQYVITNAGQGTYEIDNLPPGTYNVVAYTVGGGGFPAGLAGGYTKAVPCGLAAECVDHSLIDVAVAAGQHASGINVQDWYAPAGTFQPFPQQSSAATSVASASAAPPATGGDGSIAGDLMYPASGLPALRIVAFQVGSSAYFHTETAPGETTYQLDHLPPGTYHVVAYVIPGGAFTGGLPGGYTRAVACGLQAGCNDHTLLDVVVTPAHVATGIDPNDYYAGTGAFPADPLP